jgi:alpha,alpha-trehalase
MSGLQKQNEEAVKLLPVLNQAELELVEKLSGFRGTLVERKRFSIAVHFRNAKENRIPAIKHIAGTVHDAHGELRLSEGKKIVELQPDIDWDKGRAVLWLMEYLEVDREPYLPVYLGDDLTDEHAFDVLRDRGIGILVGDHGHPSKADWFLKNTDEVESFLESILEKVEHNE